MRNCVRFLLWSGLAMACLAQSEKKHLLFIGQGVGYAHDSVSHAMYTMAKIGQESGRFDVMFRTDVELLTKKKLDGNRKNLDYFHAVMFYTTGELPISDQQKQDLLAFVREGKGFAGVHSATDTFYKWPEYAELIGGWFNGHPWTQPVKITVADPANPLVAHLAPSFDLRDEIYQFKNFAEGRVRVLLKLDTSSVDMKARGINPGATEFPLVWVHPYGNGRVFYSALGHFDEVWDMPGIRGMLLEGMLWITGQREAPAAPR